jgi:hypothetical protein
MSKCEWPKVAGRCPELRASTKNHWPGGTFSEKCLGQSITQKLKELRLAAQWPAPYRGGILGHTNDELIAQQPGVSR